MPSFWEPIVAIGMTVQAWGAMGVAFQGAEEDGMPSTWEATVVEECSMEENRWMAVVGLGEVEDVPSEVLESKVEAEVVPPSHGASHDAEDDGSVDEPPGWNLA